MSKNRLFKILLPSVILTFGSQLQAYTINEAVAHSLATSPDLLISANLRQEVDKQLTQAYAGYLPTLDMTAGWGQQYSNNTVTRGNVITATGQNAGTRTMTRSEFNLLASQMIFDGLAVYHNVEGNKYRVKAESWRVNNESQDVALRVVEAYLDVIKNRELVGIAQNNLNVHDRIFSQISKRSESGIGRKADLDQAEGRVALARTNLMSLQHDLRDAETAFLRQVGIAAPLNMSPIMKPKLFPTNEREAIDGGLHHHPQLMAAIEDVKVTREAFKGARAPFSPRFDLQLSTTRNHDVDGSFGGSDENSAMMRMRWNLFSGGKDLAKVCETAYKMQEAQEVQNRAQRQVVQTVRFAWAIYDSNKRQLQYKKVHVDASVRTFEAYQKQFNIGQRTLLDLLDSQNELFNAQRAYSDSRYEELRGMYRLLNAIGNLTQVLGVELPKQAIPRPEGVMSGAMAYFDKSSTLFD